eukprot:c8437_g1_i1.p1 GENE.c8437_g1_i1~~c8437_g1_i1.p1  ORF type:complete len:379 (-),score=97.11 c8437_g1_i1:149-1243(-)
MSKVSPDTEPDLRQRKSSSNLKTGERPAVTSSGPERVKNLILAAGTRAPEKVRPFVVHFASFVMIMMIIWDKVQPVLSFVWKLLLYIERNLPEDLATALLGLMFCFFGGTYTATIAAYEAFCMTGWEQTKENFLYLREKYKVLKAKSDEDDTLDEDGDGIPDVDQRTPSELLARKVHLVLVSVDEPERVNRALVGIGASCLSVIAVLRVQFAKTITLAISIASQAQVFADKYGTPVLNMVIPKAYQHWTPTVIGWLCKSIAFSIAWYIQKVISAVHSALKGGLMFSRNVMNWLNKRGWLSIKHEDTNLDEIIGWAIGACGVYFQIKSGFALPFPLNLIFLPLTMLEWFIIWMVTDTSLSVAPVL